MGKTGKVRVNGAGGRIYWVDPSQLEPDGAAPSTSTPSTPSDDAPSKTTPPASTPSNHRPSAPTGSSRKRRNMDEWDTFFDDDATETVKREDL